MSKESFEDVVASIGVCETRSWDPWTTEETKEENKSVEIYIVTKEGHDFEAEIEFPEDPDELKNVREKIDLINKTPLPQLRITEEGSSGCALFKVEGDKREKLIELI